MLLEDKVAIVTGAGSGIGAASALRFAAEGAAVVVADIRAHKARETVDAITEAGGQALAVETDVADAASVEAMVAAAVQSYGGLDVIYNNAGTLRPGTAVELSVEDWDFVMAVNVRSVFLGAKYAVPAMEERGGGSIINTASVSGLHGDGGSVVYAASKAAVINLTRALSTDHASAGIRVNAICPGAIETPPVQRMMQHPGAPRAERAGPRPRPHRPARRDRGRRGVAGVRRVVVRHGRGARRGRRPAGTVAAGPPRRPPPRAQALS